ncbi:MAG: Ig-like domain-containing protein, partial [Sedimentisphaerales bacterium]|nr:Ig-like domain-containing protein [Sedimentisphaerales bacterium]
AIVCYPDVDSVPTLSGPPVLQPELWQAIHQIRHFDPDHPALDPIRAVLRPVQIARTDAYGRFEIALAPYQIEGHRPFYVLQQDYLPATLHVEYAVPGVDPQGMPMRQRLQPDPSGIVDLPAARLFPAGSVRIHILVPESEFDIAPRIRVYWWGRDPGDLPWLPLVYTPYQGSSVWRTPRLLQNQDQAFQVLAGVDIYIELNCLSGPYTPLNLGPFRLEQGQVLDLGRVELPKGIPVTVKVLDPAGRPVPDMTVTCTGPDRQLVSVRTHTDRHGEATVYLAPNSSGWIIAQDPRTSGPRQDEYSTAFAIGGQEDAGKESAGCLLLKRRP